LASDPAKPLALAALAASALVGCFLFGPTDGRISAAVMAAALASSVAGFAFSALSGAMLFHISDDTVRLVQIMMTCSLANHAVMTWTFRRAIRWPSLSRSLAGGLLGLPFGVYLLFHADRRSYLVTLGLFLTAYGVFLLVRKPNVCRPSAIIDGLAGFAGGVVGGAAAFPSAFVAIWSGMQGLTTDEQRGTFQPFTLTMQAAGLAAIAIAGGDRHSAAGYDWRLLIFIPASLAGTFVGIRVYRGLSDKAFRFAVTGLLVASGLCFVI